LALCFWACRQPALVCVIEVGDMSRSFAPVAILLAHAWLCSASPRQDAGHSPSLLRGGEKLIAGVPVMNYHLAAATPRLANGTPSPWTRWIVFLKNTTSNTELRDFCQGSSCRCRLAGHPSHGGVAFLEVRGTEQELEALFRKREGRAAFVEPNVELQIIPGVPSAPPQASRQISASWGLDRIGVPETERTGEGVHIYVLDTGVYTEHEDFEGRAKSVLDVSSGDAVECQGSTTCAVDRQGHGTFCAAVAGGRQFGVAKRASIYAMKVLSDQGSGSFSWSIAALDWVAFKGERPAVASMSLGGPGRLQSMQTAIDQATQSGVTVVVAAGNEDDSGCRYSPAFVPNAITVGATTEQDARASYSNYGSCLDIYAPGSAIVSAWITSPSSSKILSGTSMACPHVSGGAALLLGSNPSWTPAQVSAGLKSTAENGVIANLHFFDPRVFLSVRDASRPMEEPGQLATQSPNLVSVVLLAISAAFFFAGAVLWACAKKPTSPAVMRSPSGRELLQSGTAA